MTAPARINLVMIENISDAYSEIPGYSSGVADSVYNSREEIELLNPNGDAAAIVLDTGYTDSSIVYEYSNGSLGTARKRSRHRIQLAIDYISNSLRSKLETWMRRQYLVSYCPGYGLDTTIALRPVPGSGSTMRDGTTAYKDLTGHWNITTTGGINAPVWLPDVRAMYAPDGQGTANKRRVVPTRAGTGQMFERAKTSRFQPWTPLSAAEGNNVVDPNTGDSGWTKWGTHSSDITFTHVPGGFGAYNSWNSLIVSADNATSRIRGVIASSLWDSADPNYQGYEFTGSYRATVSIWIRGVVGAGAELSFQHGSNIDTVELDSLDLSQWTKVSLELLPYNDDWESAVPILLFNLSSGASAGGAPYLEIGPTYVAHSSTAAAQYEPEPGTLTTAPSEVVANFKFPASGSMYISFFWPESSSFTIGTVTLIMTSAGGNVGRVYLNDSTVYFVNVSGTTISGNISPRKGHINTVCVTWGGATQKITIYYNGNFIVASSAGADNDIAAAAVTLYFGYLTAPLLPLTWRIDRKVYSANDVAEIDTTLRDATCNDLAVCARGRGYRIVRIPNTPRNQSGGTVWVGTLELEEYTYDHNWADLVSEDM